MFSLLLSQVGAAFLSSTSSILGDCRQVDFKFKGLLAMGSNAQIELAWHYQTERWVAVKSALSATDSLSHEARMMQVLAGPGIPEFYCLMRMLDGWEAIVMEYIPGVDLERAISLDKKSYGMQQVYPKPLLKQIIALVDHLHFKGYVHGDLKPENFMFHNGLLWLIDFGTCRPVNTPFSARGSLLHLAPEVWILTEYYGYAADWYAVGIIFHEMLTGNTPFNANEEEELSMEKQNEIKLPKHLSQATRNLLFWLTHPDPKQRASSAQEILQHPYFS